MRHLVKELYRVSMLRKLARRGAIGGKFLYPY
jgi:hypothetical protein